MRLLLSALILPLALSAAASAQTTGMPGTNDFTINGLGSGSTSCTTLNLGGTLGLAINGVPNAAVIGGVANQCSAGALSVGANTGTLDLPPTSFSIWFDGTSSGTIGALAGQTDGNGQWQLSVTGTPQVTGSLGGVQFALLHPAGLEMTQAYDVNVVGSQCSQQPNPGPTTDDGFIQVTFAAGMFPFYGTTHASVFMNDNGNLTFNNGDSDFSSTESEMLSNDPRIAPCWGDFVITNGGNESYGESGGVLTATWMNVPMFGASDQNTFCTSLDVATGVIMMHWDQMQLMPGSGAHLTQVVGISPGGGLSGPNNLDISATSLPYIAPNTNDAIYEDTALPPSTGFDLSFQVRTFVPSGALGMGPYVMQ